LDGVIPILPQAIEKDIDDPGYVGTKLHLPDGTEKAYLQQSFSRIYQGLLPMRVSGVVPGRENRRLSRDYRTASPFMLEVFNQRLSTCKVERSDD
jgi:hypothetical protein